MLVASDGPFCGDPRPVARAQRQFDTCAVDAALRSRHPRFPSCAIGFVDEVAEVGRQSILRKLQGTHRRGIGEFQAPIQGREQGHVACVSQQRAGQCVTVGAVLCLAFGRGHEARRIGASLVPDERGGWFCPSVCVSAFPNWTASRVRSARSAFRPRGSVLRGRAPTRSRAGTSGASTARGSRKGGRAW